MAEMLIAMARILESQNAVGHQIDKKIYDDMSIEFGYHGANDFHGQEGSVNYERMSKIAEGMFYADLSAMTNEAFHNRAGSITTKVDWENAKMENYTQHPDLEQFFVGANAQ